MATHMRTAAPLESNFLVPNGTFFVELLAFAIAVLDLRRSTSSRRSTRR